MINITILPPLKFPVDNENCPRSNRWRRRDRIGPFRSRSTWSGLGWWRWSIDIFALVEYNNIIFIFSLTLCRLRFYLVFILKINIYACVCMYTRIFTIFMISSLGELVFNHAVDAHCAVQVFFIICVSFYVLLKVIVYIQLFWF